MSQSKLGWAGHRAHVHTDYVHTYTRAPISYNPNVDDDPKGLRGDVGPRAGETKDPPVSDTEAPSAPAAPLPEPSTLLLPWRLRKEARFRYAARTCARSEEPSLLEVSRAS